MERQVSPYKMVEISFGDQGEEETYRLKLDRRAIFNIEADPRIEPLIRSGNGKELLDLLREKGAVAHNGLDQNGVLLPARERKKNDRIVHAYMEDGVILDPSLGVPAVQVVDPQTGKMKSGNSYYAPETMWHELSEDQVRRFNETGSYLSPHVANLFKPGMRPA
jgi:hypothetical protein